MGSRSKARARAQANQEPGQRAAQPQPQAGPPVGRQALPRTVLALGVVEGLEACMVLLASVLAGVDTGAGKSYHAASGIAITLIGVATAMALTLVARGVRNGRRWARTPVMLTQIFTGIVGIYLVQSGRYEWGIPALVLAAAGIGLLLAPASVAVLTPGRARKP